MHTFFFCVSLVWFLRHVPLLLLYVSSSWTTETILSFVPGHTRRSSCFPPPSPSFFARQMDNAFLSSFLFFVCVSLSFSLHVLHCCLLLYCICGLAQLWLFLRYISLALFLRLCCIKIFFLSLSLSLSPSLLLSTFFMYFRYSFFFFFSCCYCRTFTGSDSFLHSSIVSFSFFSHFTHYKGHGNFMK